MAIKRRQEIVNLIVGVWLFLSPWAISGPLTVPMADLNAYLVGGAIAMFAAVEVLSSTQAMDRWINLASGLWMIVSPWALGFVSHRNSAANAVIVGVVMIVFAVREIARDKFFEKWWHDRHAAP